MILTCILLWTARCAAWNDEHESQPFNRDPAFRRMKFDFSVCVLIELYAADISGSIAMLYDDGVDKRSVSRTLFNE